MSINISTIKNTDMDNLSISWDEDDGIVLLFTPDMEDKMEHYHIELTTRQAVRLYKFLGNNLPIQYT